MKQIDLQPLQSNLRPQYSDDSDEHGVHKGALLLTDLDFMEQELQQFSVSIKDTLMNKRLASGNMNHDPMEELTEVYSEVQLIE